MVTAFPEALDNFTDPSSSNNLSDTAVLHSTQHTNLNDAVTALEAKVGVNGSTVTTSIDYLISNQSIAPDAFLKSAVQLPRTRAALARVRSGNGNATFLCIGDSTTNGFYSNGMTSGDLKTHSYPGVISSLLNTAGINANFNSFMSSGNGSNALYDTRITVGSGWQEGLVSTVGGSLYYAGSTTTSLSFLPTVNVDTFVLYYVIFPGFGTFSYAVDSGSATNVNAAGTQNYGKIVISAGSLGSHTLKLNWVSGGNIGIIGVIAYNSAISQVNIINAGWNGSKSIDWYNDGAPYDPAPMCGNLQPNLTIINLGINDWSAATPIPTYTAAMQTIINGAKANGGDIVLVTPNPSSTSISSMAVQYTYVQALYGLATTNNCPIIDLWTRWVSWVSSNALGENGDTVHPNGVGYADIGQAIFNLVGNP